MNKTGRIITSILITIFLLGILLTQIELNEALSLFLSVSPSWLLIGFFFYTMGYLFRAIRFGFLLNGKIKVRELFPIVCVHYLTNNILPARTGELTYIYLVKKLQRIPVSEGISSLAIARLFDFVAIALLFFISAVFIEDAPQVVSDVLPLVSSLVILFGGVVVIIVFGADKIAGLLETIVFRLGLDRSNIILKTVREVLMNLRIIKSRRVILYSLGNSVLIWLCIYFMNYSLLRGMGFDLGIFEVAVASTLCIFTNILPIPSIGAFGVYEGAWAIGFISLGLSKEAAITSGLGVHIIIFIYMLFLGGFGLFRTRSGLLRPFTAKK